MRGVMCWVAEQSGNHKSFQSCFEFISFIFTVDRPMITSARRSDFLESLISNLSFFLFLYSPKFLFGPWKNDLFKYCRHNCSYSKLNIILRTWFIFAIFLYMSFYIAFKTLNGRNSLWHWFFKFLTLLRNKSIMRFGLIWLFAFV